MVEKEKINLKKELGNNPKFLITRMRQEWDETQRIAKKEETVRRVKEGIKTGSILATKTILTLLLIGGGLTVAAVAPNVFAAIGRIGKRRTFLGKEQFKRSIRRLRNRKLILLHKSKYGYSLKLTAGGAEVVLSTALRDLKISKPTVWDKIWHIVSFDIPNRHKAARDMLRDRLKALEFYPMQESVFIHPYPCEDEIGYLGAILNVSDYLRVIKTNEIYPDEDLKDFFDLE